MIVSEAKHGRQYENKEVKKMNGTKGKSRNMKRWNNKSRTDDIDLSRKFYKVEKRRKIRSSNIVKEIGV